MPPFGNVMNNNMQGGMYPSPNNQMQMQPQQPMFRSEMMNPQQQRKKIPIPAMLVENEEAIVANDVPMDGSIALFMTSDYSKIYVRRWNGKGYIDNFVFIEDIPQQQEQTQSDPFAPVMERLDKIENMLKRNNNRPYKPYKKQEPKADQEGG